MMSKLGLSIASDVDHSFDIDRNDFLDVQEISDRTAAGEPSASLDLFNQAIEKCGQDEFTVVQTFDTLDVSVQDRIMENSSLTSVESFIARYKKYNSDPASTVTLFYEMISSEDTKAPIKPPDGIELEGGTLACSSGHYYIPGGKFAKINGFDLSSSAAVMVFFDGKGRDNDRTYISIGKDLIVMNTIPGSSSIIASKDSLAIGALSHSNNSPEPVYGSHLILDVSGKNPKLIVRKDGPFAIINDGLDITNTFNAGVVNIARSERDATSSVKPVPMEFSFVDELGQPTAMNITGPDVTGNSSYFAIDQSGALTFDKNADLNRGYSVKDFNEKYPDIKLLGELDSAKVKFALDYLDSIPPEVVASIKNIDYPKIWPYGEEFRAFATTEGIHLKMGELDRAVFRHEASHATVDRIVSKFAGALPKEIGLRIKGDDAYITRETEYGDCLLLLGALQDKETLDFMRRAKSVGGEDRIYRSLYPRHCRVVNSFIIPLFMLAENGLMEEFLKLVKDDSVRARVKTEFDNSFLGKWSKIAGDCYLKNCVRAAVDVGRCRTWSTETSESNDKTTRILPDMPRNGFIKADAATNMHEDISYFCSLIEEDPNLLRELVGSKEDPRYRQKFDLLYQYGFITETEYMMITVDSGDPGSLHY